MKGLMIVLVTAGTLVASGCSNMSTTEQRTLSGGAIGAGAGAAVSGLTGGSVLGGALLGGAAGAVGGYLYDHHDRHR